MKFNHGEFTIMEADVGDSPSAVGHRDTDRAARAMNGIETTVAVGHA